MKNTVRFAGQNLSRDETDPRWQRYVLQQRMGHLARDPHLIPVADPLGVSLLMVIDKRTCLQAEVQGPPLSDQMQHERYVEILHREADLHNGGMGIAYFVAGEIGPIKIGTTVSMKSRLATIQSCSPLKLTVLATAPGGAQREAAYHAQFAGSRLHGEWFDRHPDILAEIARLNSPSPIGDEA